MVVVSFFSLAQSRLERYGLPALPAVAIIVGVYWQHLSERPGRRAVLTSSALLLLIAGVALTAMAFLMPVEGAAFTRLVAALDGHYREHPDQALLFAGDAVRIAQPSSLLLVACGVGTLLTARIGRARLTFVVWLAFLVPALLFVDRGTRLLAVNRSQRDAAEIVNRDWEEGAHLVVAGPYDDAMSVTFYTERPTYLVDGNSTDLAFGIRHAAGSPLVLTGAQLEALWRSPHRLFLLTNQPPPAGASVLLARPTYTLVTNQPLSD